MSQLLAAPNQVHDEGSSEGSGSRGAAGDTAEEAPRWWLRPTAVSAVLTVLCLPIISTVPQPGLDPSWHLGLSLVHLRHIPAGSGFVFNYGPLGFLAVPNVVWLPGAILGLAYLVGSSFALYSVLCRSLQEWLTPVRAAAVTAVFALCAVQTASPPELASLALVVWGLRLLRPNLVNTALPARISVAFGGVAALQLLVKFSAGGAAIAVAAIVVLARPPRLRNVALVATSFAITLVVLWLAGGQPLGDLAAWLRGSMEISTGYSSAMAVRAGFDGSLYWLAWLACSGVLGLALWRLISRKHLRALPFAAVIAVAVWFLTKAGFVRLDPGHAAVTYFGLGVLIAAIGWDERWTRYAIVGIVIALGAIVVTEDSPALGDKVTAIATRPGEGLAEAGRVVRSAIAPSYRSAQLDLAASRIRAAHRIPRFDPVARRDARVHAEPHSIATVWAYHLPWQPVPVFQSYQANTHALDLTNAKGLSRRRGPDTVIRDLERGGLDGRIAAWESPTYMVELTCRFRVIARTGRTEVLERTTTGCARPVPLHTEVLRDGATAHVPTPRDPRSLVVATFDYPDPLAERLVTSLLKPTRLPVVVADGREQRFVAGTARSLHLVHVPDTLDGRAITNAALDLRTIAFPDAPGPVVVHFHEIAPR